MNKIFVKILNIIVMLMAITIFAYMWTTNQFRNVNFSYIMIFVLLFGVIHTLRFVRMYLIILEEKIAFLNFFKIYVKTTFVGFLLPFKSGELYKMVCIGDEISNLSMGILSVIIDRIFDMYILVAIMVPYELMIYKNLSVLSTLVLVVMIFITFMFLSFPSFYKYTNKFFMLNSSSKKSIVILELCEAMNNYYSIIKKLLDGRWGMLSTLTIFIWIIEFLEINALALMLNDNRGVKYFIDYLNYAFSLNNNALLSTYIILGSALMMVIVIIIYSMAHLYSRGAQKNA
ncbi:hypothetical protein [Intestinibacter sp.]